MRALTLYQPYAWAVVSGIKRYETRSQKTNIRGRIAIYAAMKQIFPDPLRECKIALPEPDTLDYAAVIGTVEIVDCIPVEEAMNRPDWILDGPTERALGDWTAGRFAYVLRFPEKFPKPVPAKGRQGWWNWHENHLPPRVCGTCPFFDSEGVCWNADSVHLAHFTETSGSCPEWKPKGGYSWRK